MSGSPTKPIVTEGDAKVNYISALGDLSIVTTELMNAINHLRDIVSEHVTNGTPKN